MFCPKCGCEYRDGFYNCSDCNVSLEIKMQDNAKYPNENNIIKKIKTFIKTLIGSAKEILKSNSCIEIVKISYKTFLIFLFLHSYFTIKYISLWVIGPDWEIPVDLVGPILRTGFLKKLTFLLFIISFLTGFMRFKLQKLPYKILSIFWLISIITLSLFAGASRQLSDSYITLIINYWWVGVLISGIVFITLIYKDSKVKE